MEAAVGRGLDPLRTRGLIWHTQGSGKTFTMIKTAEKLFRAPGADKPTILLMIDRNELEDQMLKNLAALGLGNLEHAGSIARLNWLLRDDYRGIIVTMIHKFRDMPAGLNTRSNIYVLIDEAHRTTGGDLGNFLMAGLPNATFRLVPHIAMGVFFLGFFIFQIVRFFNSRRIMRLGYDAEVATGQELNRMMLQGYYVYHDFVADKFNIDHIVVGPAGIFALETKGRAKPAAGNGVAGAKVVYDGEHLRFPKWVEVKPLEQAKNQAQWLERWLSSATGEKTPVRPVLALPGWYVERTSPKGIPVINPKGFKSITKPINGNVLDDRRIKSIIHQIEQRCKNIESRAVESLGGSAPNT